MKNIKHLIMSGALAACILLQSCAATDVVKTNAIKSFNAFAEVSKDSISLNDNRWVYSSPSKDLFRWSKDFSLGKSDLSFEFDAAPFIAAGLDTKKLSTEIFSYSEATERLTMNFDLGSEKLNVDANSTPSDTFKNIIEKYRSKISYHESLGHFGLDLPGENKFEWAKDIASNDKDVVFVLNPKPFIDAGVKPDKVSGWVFMNMEGKDLFLKPFNIK